MVLAFLAAALTSCATKDPAPLIADPNSARETALPWNEQQKWETEGQLGQVAGQQSRR